MARLEFDDEGSRLVDEFNASTGAMARRARIVEALALKPGNCVLDVGSGPGHQALELSDVVGSDGQVEGIDPAVSALEIAQRRCAHLTNVNFRVGEASKLPFPDSAFDAAMSSQTFEYLEDIPGALAEMYRVVREGGRVLVHDTDWGTILWQSSDRERMARIMSAWDDHLADPHLPQSLGMRLTAAGFTNVSAEPVVQLELNCGPGTVSAILMKFIVDYVASHGIPEDVAGAWAADLHELSARGEYFYSSNEYIFTGTKP